MASDQGETAVFRTIGRYRAFGELGRGAMGVVYRGFDPVIGRTVALKTLSIDTADPQAREFRERLYREAAAAGALSHPNIVTIYDIIDDGAVTAVAMEFIEGRPLAAIIAERAPLPLDVAVDVLDQICSALDHAGSQGIVHRDIKPANILVTSAGRAKVTDFGVARLALSTMTQAGTVLGSPSYMSPEQVRGLSLDGRSDLFSAAVVFFEMITRERPFAGNDVATTMYRIAHEPPTPPGRFNPAIGPGITGVLERAFAKSPSDRFQTGSDLVAALRAAASLGPARGSSASLAAFAAAPPPVPPIVAPVAAPPATAAAHLDGVQAEVAPIPAAGPDMPVLADSSGHALAPIPVAGASRAAAASPSGSNLALPTIPLPPGQGGPPAPRAAGTPPARPRGRGLLLAGVAGAVVVVGVIAGALLLRGSPDAAGGAPGATVTDAPARQPAQADVPLLAPAASVETPAAQVPPAPPPPPSGPAAAGRGTAAAPARGTLGSAAGRTGARPLPSQAAAPSLPAGSSPAGGAQAPAQPGGTAAERAYLATEVDVKPEVLTQVAPSYPEEAAKKNVQDVVVLQVLVDSGGRPQSIKLLRGSRTAPALDAAAEAAVRQWTFRPARKNGRPVACLFNVGVPFPPAK
jgi:eukaryotic-like serine/threonine-protein kinase